MVQIKCINIDYLIMAIFRSRHSFSKVSNKCRIRQSSDKFDTSSSSGLSLESNAKVQLNKTCKVFLIVFTYSSFKTKLV